MIPAEHLDRVAGVFKENSKRREKTLIIYFCAGDPDLETTKKLVLTAAAEGADVVELGVPFSDPIADGPAIQAASTRALKAGTNLPKILEMVSEVRARTEVPIILMSYYNPLLRFGFDSFAVQASSCGVDGLIVPDLPLEESEELRSTIHKKNISMIPLVAPTTPQKRLGSILASARGFIYCVSLTGVTGARKNIAPGIPQYLTRVKKQSSYPVALGFGISTNEQAREAASWCDGVIVGSAVVNLVASYSGSQDLLREVSRFIGGLKKAVNEACSA